MLHKVGRKFNKYVIVNIKGKDEIELFNVDELTITDIFRALICMMMYLINKHNFTMISIFRIIKNIIESDNYEIIEGEEE